MIAAIGNLKLPQTMTTAYDQLSRDINQTGRAAMLFVSLAPRPLTVNELENLVAIWFKDAQSDDLWDFRPNNFLEHESHTKIVHLTHFSIREWILSKIDPDSAAAVSKTLGSLVPPVHPAYSTTLFRRGSLTPPMLPSGYSTMRPIETQFAELFIGQAELRVLTLDFLKARGQYGFEETFTKLLKAYSTALIPIAPSTTAKVAALLAGDKAVHISSAMTQASGYLNDTSTVPGSNPQDESRAEDSDFLMDKFFESLDMPAEGKTSSSSAQDLGSQVPTTSRKAQHPVIGNMGHLNTPTTDEAAMEAITPEESADGLYVDLSGVKVWLVTAPPFAQMLEELSEKLNPLKTLPLIPGADAATAKTTSRSSLQLFLGVVIRTLLLVIPGEEEPLLDGFKRVRWTCVSVITMLTRKLLTY